MTSRFTRRASLLRFLGLAAAAGGGAAWKLQSADGAGPLAVSSGAVACVLTPELTEGPYYVSGEKLRRNVTEGKKGMPLLLKLSVVNVSTCRPIAERDRRDLALRRRQGVYSRCGREHTPARTSSAAAQRHERERRRDVPDVYLGLAAAAGGGGSVEAAERRRRRPARGVVGCGRLRAHTGADRGAVLRVRARSCGAT